MAGAHGSYLVVGPRYEGLLCSECNQILNKAVQTADGLRMCQICFDSTKELPDCTSMKTGICVLDEDGNPSCYPDIAVRREVKNLTVICSNIKFGCDFIGVLDAYFNEHAGNCKYTPCPNMKNGCQELIQASEVQEHIAHKCQFGDVSCQYCGMDTLQHLIQDHSGECLKYPLECPLCDATVPREQMPMHRESKCPKFECLCGEIFTKNDPSLEFHMSNPALLAAHVLPTMKTFHFSTMNAVKTLQSKISELQLQLQSSISYHDGVFLWRIPDIRRKKHEAVEGRVTSICSIPFYTGRNGYKMCIRAYLNGDGVGYKTHLSLFFVLMKGEFDALLKWPFKEKVTLTLVEQNHRKRNIVQTFKPNIKRGHPKSDINGGYNCPRFAELAVLDDHDFMKDDVVFIKCVVDTTTIFHP